MVWMLACFLLSLQKTEAQIDRTGLNQHAQEAACEEEHVSNEILVKGMQCSESQLGHDSGA